MGIWPNQIWPSVDEHKCFEINISRNHIYVRQRMESGLKLPSKPKVHNPHRKYVWPNTDLFEDISRLFVLCAAVGLKKWLKATVLAEDMAERNLSKVWPKTRVNNKRVFWPNGQNIFNQLIQSYSRRQKCRTWISCVWTPNESAVYERLK